MSKTKQPLPAQAMQGTLVQVARLYYDEDLSQQEIADRLGVSRSLIAQYLKRARDMGIVRIRVVDPDNACAGLQAELKERLGLKHLTVVPTPHGSGELASRAVAAAAADFISASLRDGDTFGLAWGRTSSRIVDLLPAPNLSRLDVVPLMGECAHEGMHSQMNNLVIRAAERLHATPHFLSLPMVLSRVDLRDALLAEIGVKNVADAWNHLDVACMGIGVVPPVPGMVVYIGEEHLPRLIEAGAVGDVCGIYYNRDGKIIESGLENRMIAANAEQLRQTDCLTAAACGADKTIAVLGAVRTRLIDALFIDQTIAERIHGEL